MINSEQIDKAKKKAPEAATYAAIAAAIAGAMQYYGPERADAAHDNEVQELQREVDKFERRFERANDRRDVQIRELRRDLLLAIKFNDPSLSSAFNEPAAAMVESFEAFEDAADEVAEEIEDEQPE